MVPLFHTVIYPSNQLSLSPPISLLKALKTAFLGVQWTRWMIDQFIQFQSQVSASIEAAVQGKLNSMQLLTDTKQKYDARQQETVTWQKLMLLSPLGVAAVLVTKEDFILKRRLFWSDLSLSFGDLEKSAAVSKLLLPPISFSKAQQVAKANAMQAHCRSVTDEAERWWQQRTRGCKNSCW